MLNLLKICFTHCIIVNHNFGIDCSRFLVIESLYNFSLPVSVGLQTIFIDKSSVGWRLFDGRLDGYFDGRTVDANDLRKKYQSGLHSFHQSFPTMSTKSTLNGLGVMKERERGRERDVCVVCVCVCVCVYVCERERKKESYMCMFDIGICVPISMFA